jgi:predicted AAA+ superfamily ATPase
MYQRYISQQIISDLQRKMVFVGGPRQVGKTTLAKLILQEQNSPLRDPNPSGYLNWDYPEHRTQILERKLPTSQLWIFDELHKYRQWRNYLKGIYDVKEKDQHILVTGSAKLDYYRFSGDSLQGRYHYLRLYPLSLAELHSQSQEDFMQLLQLGGFPEPFFQGSAIAAKRWSRDYHTRFIREDLVQLEQVHDLGTVELLALRLPELVGSPLSINALREDLQVSHKAVSSWLQIFERLYSIFRVLPFGSPNIQAVKKEQKHYHLDWHLVNDLPAKFENLVAVSLLKWVYFLQDTQGEDIELRYFRDTEKREVDFVIVENKKPKMFIEVKWNNSEISPSLRYLKAKFPEVESWQISAVNEKDYLSPEGIRVCPARRFLSNLV